MGAVSVIMIIIGGFRYVTSQGDQTQMQSAKNTILYAVIGVVVSIAAYAIVSFVVAQFVWFGFTTRYYLVMKCKSNPNYLPNVV